MERRLKGPDRRQMQVLGLGTEEKKKKRRRSLELSAMGLHAAGLICLAAGALSAVLRARYFTVGETGAASDTVLLSLLDDPENFSLATVTVICQMAELCAIPIFAFLLTEGAVRTASFKKYFLRVSGLAVLCEVPYSLLWNGTPFLATNHNIVFGTLMALAMLWFFRAFPERSGGHLAVRALAVLGCFLWCNFLGIEHGAATVLVTAALWAGRDMPNIKILAGFAACAACVLLTPMYLVSALGLLFVHLYGGKPGRYNRYAAYLSYPALLVFSYICCIV